MYCGCSARTKRTRLASNPRDPGMIATRYTLERTLAAFRDGTRPPTSAVEGREVLQVIAACYHAAERGARVTLDGHEAEALATLSMGAPPRA